MVEEAKAALKDGIACIVDGGHHDMGRDLDFLKKLTTQSGLPIVASGGYYMERVYPAIWPRRARIKSPTSSCRKPRPIGSVRLARSVRMPNAPMSELEKKVFRAVGKAQLRTNLPLFTHNAYGTGPNVPNDAGLRQLDVARIGRREARSGGDRPLVLSR